MKIPKIFYSPVMLPRMRGIWRGHTIPPFGIIIRDTHELDITLLIHELEHWQQYQRYGIVRFYLLYTWQCIRYGYHNAPFEVEARAAERDPVKVQFAKEAWEANRSPVMEEAR